MTVPWARAQPILGLALPIAAVLLAQTVMGLVTIAMVSHLGDAAVAGVGVANALFSMLMALLFGVDAAVQARVAQRFGARQIPLAGAVLNDGLALLAAAGALLAVLGCAAGPAAMGLIVRDPAVVAHGLAWLDAALPGLPFLAAGFAFSAYRNGAGTPRHALLVTLLQVSCGALLGYLLIFGAPGVPPLGTAGAGLGLALAALVGLAAHLLLAMRIAPVPGALRTPPSWPGIRDLLRIGLPVGLQQSLVYLGTAFTFAIVGLLSTGAVAAMDVVLAMMLLSILPASGMGIAAATLVGTALGRGDAADARRWGWEVARLGSLLILAFSVVIVVAPGPVLGLFVADRATIEAAALPLAVMAMGMGVDAFGRILGFALRGAGATRLVATVSFALQWGVQLPLSWLIGVHFGLGLLGIAINRLVLIAAESLILTLMWRNGFWVPLDADATREGRGH
ncbi:MAG TPA: MATE family efflux transporter [Reyranella sp.]|nr:MATE family efflux transporter [Reyranella sp.]